MTTEPFTRATAIVLAPNLYRTPNGKTAHGLVRGSERFDVLAVVDPDVAGLDAGSVLDGIHRDIPIVSSLSEAITTVGGQTDYCVVGVATHGGKLTAELRAGLLEAIERGISVVNGLHEAASDDPALVIAAEKSGAAIIDIRKPKPKSDLCFWKGDIFAVRAPRIAVLGTDCALGKRTTTRILTQTLNDAGIRAEMIYTGQTGWMQGARYGFVFDATLNDYVCGELEDTIVRCDLEACPDVMLLEGQSSLRNPSGPCGSELLLSAGAHGVVLQHAPGRAFFEGYEEQELRIPSLESEIDLIACYGARTIAVTLNGQGMSSDALVQYQRTKEQELGIPVVPVLEEGLQRLVPIVRGYIDQEGGLP